MTTCILQVNERGSWRNVVSAFDYSVAEEVKAGVSMVAAVVREYRWRIVEVRGQVLWQMKGPFDGFPAFEWEYRPYCKEGRC